MTPRMDLLCLQCGLCCNGVLFADVRSEPGDRSPLFTEHARVRQPCPAFQATTCACAIYADRPARCRKFACRQLLGVQSGKLGVPEALKRIQAVRRLAAKVERLLNELGFNEPTLPLSRRFQHCQRTASRGKFDRKQLEVLAELQLTVHELNLRLARDFYPA